MKGDCIQSVARLDAIDQPHYHNKDIE